VSAISIALRDVAAGEDLGKRVVDAVTGSRGGRRGGRGQRKGKLILHSTIRILNKLRICTGRHSREFILGPQRWDRAARGRVGFEGMNNNDPTRSWLRCRALRPTRSEVERVWTIGPTRCDLLKLETDTTDHISGISKAWADPLDNPIGSASGLDCNVQRANLSLIDARHVTIFPGINYYMQGGLCRGYCSNSGESGAVYLYTSGVSAYPGKGISL
jgi:hypothetical protein